jgi:tetratricopeptide (TPR) repeat protein
LNNLGNLYADLQDFSKSEIAYNEALDIRRQLASDNPQVYESFLASTLVNLGLLYCQQEQYQKAIPVFEESLLHYKNLSSNNPSFFQYYINILVNQSYLFIYAEEFVKSEQYAREAILYDASLLTAYTNLAASLLFQGKYTEAEDIYRQYKDEKKDSFHKDLQDFEAAGVIPDERKADVEKIRKLLNE